MALDKGCGRKWCHTRGRGVSQLSRGVTSLVWPRKARLLFVLTELTNSTQDLTHRLHPIQTTVNLLLIWTLIGDESLLYGQDLTIFEDIKYLCLFLLIACRQKQQKQSEENLQIPWILHLFCKTISAWATRKPWCGLAVSLPVPMENQLLIYWG